MFILKRFSLLKRSVLILSRENLSLNIQRENQTIICIIIEFCNNVISQRAILKNLNQSSETECDILNVAYVTENLLFHE